MFKLNRVANFMRATMPVQNAFRTFAVQPITEISPLTAISPIDGRYAKACNSLRAYYSEYALQRFRVFVEIQWFKKLFAE
jgi:adenylosuccinate lyase